MEFTQENFDQLISDLTSAKAENETLKAEIDTITKINDELVAKIETLSVVKDVKTPADLTKALSEVKKVSIPKESFEVDGVKYKFISPVFMFKKERIVAADVMNDTAKLAELVAAGCGLIQKV